MKIFQNGESNYSQSLAYLLKHKMKRIIIEPEIIQKDAKGKPLRSKYLNARQNLTPKPENVDIPQLSLEIHSKRVAYFADPSTVPPLKYTLDELKLLDYWCESSDFHSLAHIGLAEYSLTYGAILITVRTGYMTIGSLTNAGRRVFTIVDNGKQRQIHANVLLAWAFLGIPPTPDHDTVDHMDIDETNDKIYNLRWATRFQQAMNRKKNMKPRKGRSIIQLDKVTLAEIKVWSTIKEATKSIGLSKSTIVNGIRFGHIIGGYRWIYNNKLLVDDYGNIEEWRLITYDGYDNVWASSTGRIYTKFGGMWFGNTNRKGRKMATVPLKDGSSKTVGVHQLVALAFIGPVPDDAPTVDHIDGNPMNNTSSNLRYLSVGDNNKHALAIGNRKVLQRDFAGFNALKPVVQLTLDGQFVEEYMNTLQAHEVTGFREKGIKRAASGERPNANRFIWVYASQYFK
jgi:hypothetical protein